MSKYLSNFSTEIKKIFLFSFVSLLTFFIFINNLLSQSLEEIEIAKTTIWEKEKKIYESRAINGLDFYIANSSTNYLGWPPGIPSPSNLNNLKENQKNVTTPNLEQIEIFFNDFTMSENTGIIYYNTYRTRMPDGTQVNQRYQICHIWKRDLDNNWKLLGAMGRLLNN